MEAEHNSLDEIEIKVYADDLLELADMANVDVEVLDRRGRRWSATFFTLDGLVALFEKNAVTGEYARRVSGLLVLSLHRRGPPTACPGGARRRGADPVCPSTATRSAPDA